MAVKKVPEGTISRLFLYLREVTELTKVAIKYISSAELGERTNLSDAQVRKDLGYFGQFGISGAGYSVTELKTTLEKILGKDRRWNVALIGAGHLGSALLAYSGFKQLGLDLVAAFDSSAEKIGKEIGGGRVSSLDDLGARVRDQHISIAIIAVPAHAAQDVAARLVEAGVSCILNCAPISLNVPEHVKVKTVDLSRELEVLSYFLVNRTNGEQR